MDHHGIHLSGGSLLLQPRSTACFLFLICKRFSSSPRGNKLFPKLFWVGGQPLSFTKNVTYQKTRTENKSTLNFPEKYSPTGQCVTPSHTSFPQHFRWWGGVNMHRFTALQPMPYLKRGGPLRGLPLH